MRIRASRRKWDQALKSSSRSPNGVVFAPPDNDTSVDAPPCRASICPTGAIPHELAANLNALEKALEPLPLWLIIQDAGRTGSYADIDDDVADALLLACVAGHIRKDQPIALLIDSDGGTGRGAYRIASILREHCGGFIALVPRRAKSAATLLALGADQVLLGRHAELGPIDAQYFDAEQGQFNSALADVEAMSRVQGFATQAITLSWDVLYRHLRDQQVSQAALIDPTVSFATKTIEPLLMQFDITNYSQRARDLAVGEKYAEALLERRYSPPVAKAIAEFLVRGYPEHEFIIDQAEVNRVIGRVSAVLNPQVPLPSLTDPPPSELQDIFDTMFLHLRNVSAIGRIMPAGEASAHDDFVLRVQQEMRADSKRLRL